MAEEPFYRQDDEPARQRVLAALLVSLLLHVSFFGVVQLGNQLNWWEAKPFSMFRKVRFTPEEIAKIQQEQMRLEEERRQAEPTIFVQVTQPSEETPKETPFYSSVSSRAANPDPANSNQPKVDGKQSQSVRTEDAPRVASGRPTPPPQPEAPGPADASPESVTKQLAKLEQVARMVVPKLTERVPEPMRQPGLGEVALPTVTPKPVPKPPPTVPVAKVEEPEPPPSETPPPTPVTVTEATPKETAAETAAPRARPRTLTEAKVRQSLLAGEKMRQEGGVQRKGPVGLEVKGLQFGAYDEALVMAVQNRWFALLDERRFAGGATGKVVVKFNLHADGSVRIVEPHESSVDALLTSLCVRAVRDPSPYEKWPSDMLRMIGSNVREMRFTFYYN